MAKVPALGNAVPGAMHDGETARLIVQRVVLPCVSAICPVGCVGAVEAGLLKVAVNVTGEYTTIFVAEETGVPATVKTGVAGETVTFKAEAGEPLKLGSPE